MAKSNTPNVRLVELGTYLCQFKERYINGNKIKRKITMAHSYHCTRGGWSLLFGDPNMIHRYTFTHTQVKIDKPGFLTGMQRACYGLRTHYGPVIMGQL